MVEFALVLKVGSRKFHDVVIRPGVGEDLLDVLHPGFHLAYLRFQKLNPVADPPDFLGIIAPLLEFLLRLLLLDCRLPF